MIKIALLLISFGLSTLTTLLMKLDATWKVVLGIIGFGVVYVIAIIAIFFIVATFMTMNLKRDAIAECYGKKERKQLNNYLHVAMSLFGIKICINGLNKIPQDTNFVLVQNHRSSLDPMITDVALKKYELIFAAKASLFHIPWFGKYLSKIGYVKLRRTACTEDLQELNRAVKFVTEDQCSFGIYPEGTRNRNYPYPPLLDLKEGTFDVIKRCNRPIVVTVIHGTEKVNHLLLLKSHKVQIDVLTVITPEEYKDLSLKELTRKVRNMMLDAIEHPIKTVETKRQY